MDHFNKMELKKHYKDTTRVYQILVRTLQDLDKVMKEMEKRLRILDTD